MIIEYCEKCSSRIDAACYMDPSNAAKYCLKCGAGNSALVSFDLQQKPVAVHDRRPASSTRLKTPSGTRMKSASSSILLKAVLANSSGSGDQDEKVLPGQPPDSFNKHVGNMAFYFCEKCGRRLSETDLAQGLAKNKQVKGVYCSSCSVGVNTMEMDAINLNELSADQRKNLDSKPESTPQESQNKSLALPRTTQSRKPASAKKSMIVSTIPIFLFVLAAALFFAAANYKSDSTDKKSVSSTTPLEKKNSDSVEKKNVREAQAAGNSNDKTGAPLGAVSGKLESPSSPVVVPGPDAAPTDLQIKAERERQALKELQELKEKRESELKSQPVAPIDPKPSVAAQVEPPPKAGSTSISMGLVSKDTIVGEAEKKEALGYRVDAYGRTIGSQGSVGTRTDQIAVFGYRLQALPMGTQVTGARFLFPIQSLPNPALDVYLLKTSNPDKSGTTFFYHGPSKDSDLAKLVGTTQNAELKNINGQQKVEFVLGGEALALLKSYYGGDNTPDQEEVFFRLNLNRDPPLRPHLRSVIGGEPELILEHSAFTK